jgi:hypothetical protein
VFRTRYQRFQYLIDDGTWLGPDRPRHVHTGPLSVLKLGGTAGLRWLAA